jgi:hypothetical protein
MPNGTGVITDTEVVLDNLPESVISSIEVSDRWFNVIGLLAGLITRAC